MSDEAPIAYFTKRTNEVLDYDVLWADLLTPIADTISTSTWTTPGLTQPTASSTSGTTTKVWLSGGQQGHAYTVTNKITTTGTRTFERCFVVKVI